MCAAPSMTCPRDGEILIDGPTGDAPVVADAPPDMPPGFGVIKVKIMQLRRPARRADHAPRGAAPGPLLREVDRRL
jgi:hypothetical protein